MQGVDVKAAKELAGHRDIQTTMKYAHLAPGHLKDSVEKLKWQEPDLSSEASGSA